MLTLRSPLGWAVLLTKEDEIGIRARLGRRWGSRAPTSPAGARIPVLCMVNASYSANSEPFFLPETSRSLQMMQLHAAVIAPQICTSAPSACKPLVFKALHIYTAATEVV